MDSRDAKGAAALCTGLATGSLFTLGSYIHTFMSAPMLSLATVAGSTAMTMYGAHVLATDPHEPSTQTVNVSAS